MNTNRQVDYRILVHHEDDAYWAEVVELPGCFAAGDTLDELWTSLQEAVESYLSTPDTQVQVRINSRTPADQQVEAVDARLVLC